VRIKLTLPTATRDDCMLLLDRATEACGLPMPPDVTMHYRTWIESLDVLYDGLQRVSFGVNAVDEANSLIAALLSSDTDDGGPSVSSSGAILRFFREYFMFAVAMLPVGVSAYFLPSNASKLILVVTDEKPPKKYVKLI
jgi:hypothetical protein